MKSIAFSLQRFAKEWYIRPDPQGQGELEGYRLLYHRPVPWKAGLKFRRRKPAKAAYFVAVGRKPSGITIGKPGGSRRFANKTPPKGNPPWLGGRLTTPVTVYGSAGNWSRTTSPSGPKRNRERSALSFHSVRLNCT